MCTAGTVMEWINEDVVLLLSHRLFVVCRRRRSLSFVVVRRRSSSFVVVRRRSSSFVVVVDS